MNMIKVSDYIVKFFIKNGINKCFTVTGGGAMHLNDSFGHHPDFECIYNHHEQACSMAAEGYTRISGKPAIVCVTSGPGTTNAMTGVLGAWLDSLPMIVISGQMPFNTTIKSNPLPLRQLGFQEFNIIDSVKCMTKYSEMITDSNYIAYHLEKALFDSQCGRKGPVWLDIPLNIQSAIIDEDNLVHFEFISEVSTHTISSDCILHILNKINNSKKPVILAGHEIRMSNSYQEFLDLVSALKIPVVTEWNSCDLIWDEHTYYAGRPGTIGNRGGNFVLQNADLVISIGCQLSLRQISYAWANFAKNAYKIAVSVDKYELIKPTLTIDYPINCDVKTFIRELNSFANLQNVHNENTGWYHWCKSINKKYPVVLNKHFDNDKPLSVYAFTKVLSNFLQEGDIVALANGAACVVGLQAIEIKPFQRIFTNAGASSMGYGITAAIGACFASTKNDRIVCLEGDGSIQMNLQELQTIIHNDLNIKLFWINNDGYHSIKQTQNSMFQAKEKGFCGANRTSGISFPSAEKIANAYGFKYFKISNIEHLSLIDEVLNSQGPVICEVVTNPDEVFEPKLQSKLLDDGIFFTPSLEDMYPFLPKEEMQENIFE